MLTCLTTSEIKNISGGNICYGAIVVGSMTVQLRKYEANTSIRCEQIACLENPENNVYIWNSHVIRCDSVDYVERKIIDIRPTLFSK